MAERRVVEYDTCLLIATTQGDLKFPQKDIFKCKLCPNRSDDVGDMGKRCVVGK